LHIDAGAELKIEESQMIEIENYRSDVEHAGSTGNSIEAERVEKIPIENGKIKLPDWVSDVTTLVWCPICYKFTQNTQVQITISNEFKVAS
jgi:trafficking protein particle complex subunit 10